jgi:hypothetical protein
VLPALAVEQSRRENARCLPAAGASTMTATYTHFSDLAKVAEPPDKGTLSRTLFSDDGLKAVPFGFAQGEGLSGHTASLPAVPHFALPPGRGEAGAGRRPARGGCPWSVLACTSAI